MAETTCVSCGLRIPLGQGRSCSMCYGDPAWGRDGYMEREMQRDAERLEYERQEKEAEAKS